MTEFTTVFTLEQLIFMLEDFEYPLAFFKTDHGWQANANYNGAFVVGIGPTLAEACYELGLQLGARPKIKPAPKEFSLEDLFNDAETTNEGHDT